MAWTDQCKIEAVRQIDHKVESGLSVRAALNEVSSESDIPKGTLKRWKYPEKNVPKNGNRKKTPPTNKDVFKNADKRMRGVMTYIENNMPYDDDVLCKLAVAYITLCNAECYARERGFSGDEIREMISNLCCQGKVAEVA